MVEVEAPERTQAMTEARARTELSDYLVGDELTAGVYRNGNKVLIGGARHGGEFLSADQLEALAWWMRNKQVS